MYDETIYVLAAVIAFAAFFAMNILFPTRFVRKSRKRATIYMLLSVAGVFLVTVIEAVIFELLDLL